MVSRTGRRWTTLTQLPVAFSAGSSEKVKPGAGAEALHPGLEHDIGIGVDLDRRRLPGPHMGQLGFLEIGVTQTRLVETR